MHPIRKYMATRRARLEQARIAAATEARIATATTDFITEVDTRVRVYGLDPSLPEIFELKRDALKLVTSFNDGGLARLALMWLNPYSDVVVEPSHVTIYERMHGHVLQAWSLVEFHLRSYEVEAIQRIRVDSTGTRVYAYDNRHEVAHYKAGILDPNRFADPGNRVQNALAFVDHFTGLSLLDNWEDIHKYHWMEVTKQEDGTWAVSFDPEPAYA